MAKVKLCPDVKQIEAVIGDKNVVIVVDEIEDWYDKLDSKQQKRNLSFIQHLTEVSNSKNVLLLFSLYGYNEEILGRIRRINP